MDLLVAFQEKLKASDNTKEFALVAKAMLVHVFDRYDDYVEAKTEFKYEIA